MSDLGENLAEASADAGRDFARLAAAGGVAAVPGFATGVFIFNGSCPAVVFTSPEGIKPDTCVKSADLLWHATTAQGAGTQMAIVAFVAAVVICLGIKLVLSMVSD